MDPIDMLLAVFGGVLLAGIMLVFFVWGLSNITRIEREDPRALEDGSRIPLHYWLAAAVAPCAGVLAWLAIVGNW